tara:strand:+ start:2756 stop:2992 length:237 start_codon:yes stop_codon:yes gene_type:complete
MLARIGISDFTEMIYRPSLSILIRFNIVTSIFSTKIQALFCHVNGAPRTISSRITAKNLIWITGGSDVRQVCHLFLPF